ncbi:MAG: HAD family hydrolase [Thiotrichales bacterium]|nr:HAD family hydrolase [Thiotrichales bacterium]
MAISCITFDLDDTLWESGSVLAAAEAQFYEWLGRACPEIARVHSYDALVAHRQAHYASIPEIRHDLTRARLLWLESLLQEWGYGAELAEAGFRVFWEHRNAVTLFDDATRVLGKLGERYAIGAITNGNADVHHIGIGHHFDFVVTPAEAGAAKPDSTIFEFALNAAGASPASVVHVGDDPIRDVAGAAAIGLRTVWMNPDGSPWPGEGRPDAEIRRLDSLIAVVDAWS